MWRKGLKALPTPCCRCVCVITSSGPCRMTGDHGDPGMGAISRMQVVVHCERISPLDPYTLERQSLCESHRQRRWLTCWSQYSRTNCNRADEKDEQDARPWRSSLMLKGRIA